MISIEDQIQLKLNQKFNVEISTDSSDPILHKLNGISGTDHLVLEDDLWEENKGKSVRELIVKQISQENIYLYIVDVNPKLLQVVKKDQFQYEMVFHYLFDDTFNWLIIHNHCDDVILYLGVELVAAIKTIVGSKLKPVSPFICRDLLYGVVEE